MSCDGKLQKSYDILERIFLRKQSELIKTGDIGTGLKKTELREYANLHTKD